jgi:hypothetical protein
MGFVIRNWRLLIGHWGRAQKGASFPLTLGPCPLGRGKSAVAVRGCSYAFGAEMGFVIRNWRLLIGHWGRAQKACWTRLDWLGLGWIFAPQVGFRIAECGFWVMRGGNSLVLVRGCSYAFVSKIKVLKFKVDICIWPFLFAVICACLHLLAVICAYVFFEEVMKRESWASCSDSAQPEG